MGSRGWAFPLPYVAGSRRSVLAVGGFALHGVCFDVRGDGGEGYTIISEGGSATSNATQS